MTYRATTTDQRAGRPAEPVPALARPVRTGRMPQVASEVRVPRPETGHGLDDGSEPGQLAPADLDGRPAVSVLTGPAGYGKTQLALACLTGRSRSGAADVQAWVRASSRSAVVAAYAQAARDLGLTGEGAPAEASATRFRDWLSRTEHRWIVVFDDVSDFAVLDGLWPAGSSGRVLVTCHPSLRAADLAQLSALRPQVCRIDAFSPREALSYLAIRLPSDVDTRVQAVDLAADLGYLPLAMDLAASTMVGASMSCRDYRVRFAERRPELALPAGGVSPVEVAWTLALDEADLLGPAGLARAVLVLVALLPEGGVPAQVPMSAAGRRYAQVCTGNRVIDQNQVRAAISNLARFNLVQLDQPESTPLVAVHPAIQAAVLRLMSPSVLQAAARAAADAMLDAAPQLEPEPEALRALAEGVAGLGALAGELLWRPAPHPVLMAAGDSLADAGLTASAADHWQSLLGSSERFTGRDSASTLMLGDRLAEALASTDRVDDAIRISLASLAARERARGPRHQDTLATRASLARLYRMAGMLDEAIEMSERVLADRAWVLGMEHRETLVARRDLASCRLAAGQADQAVDLYQVNVGEWERLVGAEHQEALGESASLGYALQSSGQLDVAIAVFRKIRTISERVLGPSHPQTLATVASLAFAYRTAGRMKDAIPCYRQVLAGREATLGADHPDTLTALANLASCFHSAHRMKDAIPLYERLLADRERIQGPDHPDTLTTQGNLAGGYHSAGRMTDALPLYERALAGFERVFGPERRETLISRANLANAYHVARRRTDAIAVFERTLADAERALGADDPLTRTIKDNLHAALQLTGSPADRCLAATSLASTRYRSSLLGITREAQV